MTGEEQQWNKNEEEYVIKPKVFKARNVAVMKKHLDRKTVKSAQGKKYEWKKKRGM